ncbi:MAG: MarR family transcriptional regulator [Clostridia bacterium]|nr:MarR family transcriptional regulator [Clostridia bacterium]
MKPDLGKDNLLLTTMCRAGAVFRDQHLLCGLTFQELSACHVVRINDQMNKPTRAKDISVALEISKPAVSKLLNAMEDKGLLLRERRENDRKSVYLILTEKAIDLIEEQKATASVVTKKIFAEMGMDKAKEFLADMNLFYECYKKVEAKLWED